MSTATIPFGPFMSAVTKDAAISPEFRDRLSQNPCEALRTDMGVVIPEDLKPKITALLAGSPLNELSDEDLEMVTGGKGGVNIDTVNCVGAGGAAGSFNSVNVISLV